MTTITTETLLGDVVTEHPELARELEQRGLDYCCHGQRSLTDACRELELDPAEVVTQLAAAAQDRGPEPWAQLDMASLVDHIEHTHHRYLWEELPRLDALATKVHSVHGERHPELADVSKWFSALRADLEPHLTKEEQVLFPMIRELAGATTLPAFHCGRLANPISMMLLEHDRVGEILEELRAAADDYRVPDDGCASYRALYEGLAAVEADTHLHVHKENNVLFPAVVELEQRLPGGPPDRG